MTSLTDRLNQILPRLVSSDFLGGTGIGNEIAFYVFDYPAEDELRVRDHVTFLLTQIPKQRAGTRVRHVNLFDFLLDYLRGRNLLEKTLRMQRGQGNDAVKKALEGPLNVEKKLTPYFRETVQPRESDLVILSGVGSAYPLLRTSSLLSNLQAVMGRTPLVMFYPGKFDQVTLRLFGKLGLSASFEGEGKGKKSENYYRAFKLVP